MSAAEVAATGRTRGRLWLSLLAGATIGVVAALAPAVAQAANVYVSNGEANSIAAFATGATGSLTRMSCPGADCATGSGPQGVAMTPNGRFLYTVDADSNSISAFSVVHGGTLRPIPCRGARCATGASPYWLAIAPDGRFLYVSNYEDNRLSAFRIRRNGSLARLSCGSGCAGLIGAEEPAITPNGRYLYVPISSSDRVLAYAIHGNGKLEPISCGGGCVTAGQDPWTAELTPNGRFLYVTYWSSDLVSVFRIHPDGVLSRVGCRGCATQGMSYGLAVSPNGHHVYVANFDRATLSRFRIARNGALTPSGCSSGGCRTGPFPVAVTMSPGGQFLYTAVSGAGAVNPFAVVAGASLRPIACTLTCGGLAGPEFGQAIVTRPDQAPRAAFTHSRIRRRVRFNARRSRADAGQSIVTYHWNFGDGHRLTTHRARVSHTYSSAGKHMVTLTVTDSAGCSTALVFTGQSAYCDGSQAAKTTRRVDA